MHDSKGILIWHYQLENLLGLFFNAHDRVVELMRDINAKKVESMNLTENLRFDEKISLNDILSERMIFFNTVYPNSNGAFQLFKHLNL